MLGCHEFCGYYEWTFHYVRRRWGQAAVADLWAQAIGGESQRHYSDAAQAAGLAGLYRTWVKTGADESCDWTFTLDEARNVLRWDMRQCPSKGFLMAHDRNADEDYCDHCMGWMIPLLEKAGVEVWEHEHNHCGQCWGTMRLRGQPSLPLEVQGDIRHDPRWNRGYLDRWEVDRKQPLTGHAGGASDTCEVLAAWFRPAHGLVVVAEGEPPCPEAVAGKAGLMTDRTYARYGELGIRPLGVLIDQVGADQEALAARYLATSEDRRPLLLHAYLPALPSLDFVRYGLPRPVPLLPLLIRTGKYVHPPGGPYPDPMSLLSALAEAIESLIDSCGDY